GILLLQVMPGTPAALAELRRGDVILKVNEELVKSAEDFSAFLGDAGSGKQVKFTVIRPNAADPMAVTVKLGGTFDQMLMGAPSLPRARNALSGLAGLGIETVPLSTRAASQMAARSGLLVVAIEPQSTAAKGGVREGDVIEAIDGRIVGRGVFDFEFAPRK